MIYFVIIPLPPMLGGIVSGVCRGGGLVGGKAIIITG
jgi:hypothetical protein